MRKLIPIALSASRTAFLFGSALVVLGSSGMAGWLFGFMQLGSFGDTFIPMAPATAFFFILFGVGALLHGRMPAGLVSRNWFRISALFTSLFCGSVFLIWALGFSVDFENLFMPAAGTFGNVPLGRMSPLTSLNFVCDSLAILCLTLPKVEQKWHKDAAGLLASSAAAVTLTVLLGYLFGTPLLYGQGVIPMALPTALAFLLLDSFVLFLVGKSGIPVSLFAGPSTKARLLRAFLPLTIMILIVDALMFQLIRKPAPHMNPALYNAFSALIAAVVLAAVTSGVAKKIAGEIDRANEDKLTAQRQMLHRYKLSAVGEMAGNIAHELMNPLAIIEGKVRQLGVILGKDPPEVERAKDFAATIAETSKRMVKIVNGLRMLSRRSDLDTFEKKHLIDIIEETVALCKGKLKYNDVTIEVLPVAPDIVIECRATEISQILLNLLANASDATEDTEEKWIRLEVEEDDRGMVFISVTDSGEGVPPEYRDRIGNPFFTTKTNGKGTGLGLSISTGLAEAHGGTLKLDPTSTQTRFVLRLPKTQPKKA